MKSRLLFLVFALVLAVGMLLTGCSQAPAESPEPVAPEEPSESVAAEEPSESVAAEEPAAAGRL